MSTVTRAIDHTHRLTAIQEVCASMAVGLSLLLNPPAQASSQQFIRYEGRVAVNGVNFKGVGQFKFALVNLAGTATYWSNDGSSSAGSEPAAAVSLTVTKGRYSVRLGDPSLAPMAPLPASVLGIEELRLRVWFDDGVHGSQHLTPDQCIDATAPDGDLAPGRELRAGAAVPTPDEWRLRATEPPFGARWDVTAVWTGSEIIGWGGESITFHWLFEGFRYNPSTKTWKAVSRHEDPGVRIHPLAVWTGSEMIVWGGAAPGNVILNTGRRYDPTLDTWAPINEEGAPSTSAGSQTAVWTGSEMIIWGGADFDGNAVGQARYNPASDTWTPITTIGAPAGRFHHTSVWTGKEMIVWGGFSRENGVNAEVNTGHRYDPAADTWAVMSTTHAPTPRYYFMGTDKALWTGREMIVWGGQSNESVVKDGARYDPQLDIWTPISTVGATPQPASTVWTGKEMIVWAANMRVGARYDPVSDRWTPTSGKVVDSGSDPFLWTGTEMVRVDGTRAYHYDPATDKWTTVETPHARFNHTAVWTGSEMLGWGGKQTDSTSPRFADHNSSVARFNPGTDTWRQMSYSGAPRLQEDQTALWTGTELIVWGGRSANDDPGGRYDPATDTWTPVTAVGAPTSRLKHTAVWTGTEMVVWGGFHEGTYLGDGGRYDPALGLWSPLPSAGAPQSRVSHTAIWTGDEMIVWGGRRDEITFHHDGGRFHAAENRWRPVSTVEAPSARVEHSALWTGAEMIVWGGLGPETSLNTGARYYPATDRWIPVNPSGTPEMRYDHTAVWTGSEMVIWGGQSSGVALGSGSRYDPLADTWKAMIQTDTPGARWGHTAVWTGQEMLLWGGRAERVGTYVPIFKEVHTYTPGEPAFALTGVVRRDGALLISFPSKTGCSYTLLGSDTLGEDTWIDTGVTPLAGTGARRSFSVPATAIPSGYFRVQVSDP